MIKNYKIISLLIFSLTGEPLFAGETCLSKLRGRNLDYEYNIKANPNLSLLQARAAADNHFSHYDPTVNIYDGQFPNEEDLPFAKTEVTLAIGKEEYKCKNISDFGNYGIEESRICGPYTLKQSTLPYSITNYQFWNFSLNRITKISGIKSKTDEYILLTSTEGEIYEPRGIVHEEVRHINRSAIFYDFPLVSEYPNYLKDKTSLTKKVKLKKLRESGYFNFFNHCSATHGSVSSFMFQLLAIPIKNNYLNYLKKAKEDYTSQTKYCSGLCSGKIYEQVANSHKLFLIQKDIIPVTLRFDYILPPKAVDLNF